VTPGAYLALRRGAAGLSPADVDSMIPGWVAGTMAEIEALQSRMPASLLEVLEGTFPFDPIIARRLGEGSEARVCHGCGCSQMDACWDEERGGCCWVARNLCSDCQGKGVLAS
jgi:hypothetical protein